MHAFGLQNIDDTGIGVGLDETNTVNCPSACFSMMNAGTSASNLSWRSVGGAPSLGEPVVVTQSYQGRDGDADADCQVTSAVVRA
jgi:hypothetical protein